MDSLGFVRNGNGEWIVGGGAVTAVISGVQGVVDSSQVDAGIPNHLKKLE